ncbi:Putative manganese transporter, 11 TMS [Photobacterium marinum]|uniref:Putative manganese transporter, 11 TMS n=1 Tax=Photobacterium marinum TaxID=1056511 RepID=L8JGH7_9GAMM|nr:putative manganese transporter [Photobacterium marinum]ELR66532.1 Putative manganese transporter, 11 TMS [Photobacterium marinum]
MASLQKAVNQQLQAQQWRLANKRLILPIILIALLATPATMELTVAVLSDAFWQVASYVAATLAIYHYIASKLSQNNRLSQLLANSSRYQVVFASFMGALPGCGGAIVVITQYVSGRLSFGAVVAVLTATMGDAAFLLLAAEPETGLAMVAIGFVIGLISGWIVDAIHGQDFMRPTAIKTQQPKQTNEQCKEPVLRMQGVFWKWALLPASVIAIMGSLQMDIDQVFHLGAGTISYVGAAAAMIAMLLWATSRDVTDYQSAVAEDPKANTANLFQRVAQDTNFVTSWVVGAFLIFELTIFWTGLDPKAVFSNWAILLPLMGVLIGLLPGCGPQILVTSLYISGAVPLSAQLGNAISNDGDALFPAIALAPKAAMMATVYSTMPALIAAYSYFWLFE